MRKVLILSKKENLSSEDYWHNFFGYDNPFVEYAEYFYEDEGKCKNENPRLMAWVEENMDKGIEKIFIIGDRVDTEVNTGAWEEASISTLGTNFSL